MLRLTSILCIGLFAALMIAGQDRGQLRPGLAQAAASKAAEDTVTPASTDAAPLTVITAETAAPAVKPAVKPAATAPVVASATPRAAQPYVEPARDLVTEVQEPVFSLASVGTETVPAAPQPEVADGGNGTIWYVVANSVNVRAEPSTSSEVLGRLGSGEAALLVQAVDADWARIVIQGDGVEGFVAMRYLSPEAP